MRRILKVLSFFVYPLIFCFVITQLHIPAYAQEQITISTYYPSPYGSYKDLEVTENLNLGRKADQTLPAGTIHFYGGTDFGAGGYDNENSDPISMSRFNVANDQSELRISLGDNTNIDRDALVVGATPASGFHPLLATYSNGRTYSRGRYDLNLDGVVDGRDMATMINLSLSNATDNYGNFVPIWSGDINNSGAVDAVDTQLMVNRVIGPFYQGVDNSFTDVLFSPGSSGSIRLNVEGGNIKWGEGILSTDQGGSIELGGVNRSWGGNMAPYIDFHNTVAPGGVDDDDYSARVIADIYNGEAALWVHLHVDPSTYATAQLNGVYGSNTPVTYLRSFDFLNAPLLSGPVDSWMGLAFAALAHVGLTAGIITAIIALITSSEKFKKDIRPLSGSLDSIMKLRGVEFTWKDNNRRDTGLIAEEVIKVFPGSAVYEEDGKTITGYRVNSILGPLVEAIKEQQKQIEEQRSQIKKLEESINKLKNR